MSEPTSFNDLLMTGALGRTNYRLRRGDDPSVILAWLMEHYAMFELGDLRSLFELAQEGLSAAQRLASSPPGTTLEQINPPRLPTLRAGTVQVETLARTTAQGGSRPSSKQIRADLGQMETVEDWNQLIEDLLEESGYLQAGAEGSTTTSIPLAVYRG